MSDMAPEPETSGQEPSTTNYDFPVPAEVLEALNGSSRERGGAGDPDAQPGAGLSGV